jgi:hypothetical protein
MMAHRTLGCALVLLACTPFACMRSRDPVNPSTNGYPRSNSAAKETVFDVPPDAVRSDTLVEVPTAWPASNEDPITDGGDACELTFASRSSCQVLRSLIAAAEGRADLRACLKEGLDVAPPHGNEGQVCWWDMLLHFGRDCSTQSYGGFGVFCRGDRRGFDGFRRMATECLAGWKLDQSRGVAGKGNHGIELLRTATAGGREVVTHVQGCKVLLDDDASAGENLVISIFTTARTPDAGAP